MSLIFATTRQPCCSCSWLVLSDKFSAHLACTKALSWCQGSSTCIARPSSTWRVTGSFPTHQLYCDANLKRCIYFIQYKVSTQRKSGMAGAWHWNKKAKFFFMDNHDFYFLQISALFESFHSNIILKCHRTLAQIHVKFL